MTIDKDRFLIEARNELREWDGRIEEMKIEARRKTQDARTVLDRKVEDLVRRREDLRRRLDTASEEAAKGWADVVDDLEKTLSDFRASATNAFAAMGK